MVPDTATVQSVRWVDFACNRNRLLDRVKAAGFDYTLVIDADDELVAPPDFHVVPTMDAYEADITDGDITYPRTVLFNPHKFRYVGPAHETLEATAPVNVVKHAFGYVRHPKELSKEQRREKYLRDAEALEAELRKHPGGHPRYTFYLAQSYLDASCGKDEDLLRNALAAYEKRAHMGGWVDEVFISYLQAGRICRGLGLYLNAELHFDHAASTIPSRSDEAYFELLSMLNHNKEFELAYNVLPKVTPVDRPRTSPAEGLFVDHAVYKWKLLFQAGLTFHYTGRHAEARKTWERLLEVVPEGQRQTIRDNMGFLGASAPSANAADALVDRVVAENTPKAAATERLRRTIRVPVMDRFPDLNALQFEIDNEKRSRSNNAARVSRLEKLHERGMAYSGHGTHIPALSALLAYVAVSVPGDILEIGAGNSSTLVFNEFARAMGRRVMTLEENLEWLARFDDLKFDAASRGSHVFVHSHYRADLPKLCDSFIVDGCRWAVAFVDHAGGSGRADMLAHLADHAEFIVCHDAANTFFTGLDETLSQFEFVADYLPICPITTIVSRFREIPVGTPRKR